MVRKIYSQDPQNAEKYRQRFDRFYTAAAGVYDFLVKVGLPFWKRWLDHALPYIRGRRVLEVSFGTGYLLTKITFKYETYGIDYNLRMVQTAWRNLESKNLVAGLSQADVVRLPFDTGFFDTIVSTMAFTGYPDGAKALTEIKRVLRPGGILIIIDINYPSDENWLGMILTRGWQASGDLIRDMGRLFDQCGLISRDLEIGGFGSVHLYLCELREVKNGES